LQRAAQFALRADESHARQAATGLYYALAASVLWQEGQALAKAGDARRLLLSALIAKHRLQTRDPLEAVDCPFAESLLTEAPIALPEALRQLEQIN
jgi:acyl-CoA dehydrogenase